MFVIAGIISLGDSNAYLLSTAEEHLGVIAARSATGQRSRLKARAFIFTSLSRRKTGADLWLSNDLSGNEYCWTTQSSENPIGSCRRCHATELDLCFVSFLSICFEKVLPEQRCISHCYVHFRCILVSLLAKQLIKNRTDKSFISDLSCWCVF